MFYRKGKQLLKNYGRKVNVSERQKSGTKVRDIVTQSGLNNGYTRLNKETESSKGFEGSKGCTRVLVCYELLSPVDDFLTSRSRR